RACIDQAGVVRRIKLHVRRHRGIMQREGFDVGFEVVPKCARFETDALRMSRRVTLEACRVVVQPEIVSKRRDLPQYIPYCRLERVIERRAELHEVDRPHAHRSFDFRQSQRSLWRKVDIVSPECSSVTRRLAGKTAEREPRPRSLQQRAIARLGEVGSVRHAHVGESVRKSAGIAVGLAKTSRMASPSPSTRPITFAGVPPTMLRVVTFRLMKLFAAITHMSPIVTPRAITL